jgi:hypothetical protein
LATNKKRKIFFPQGGTLALLLIFAREKNMARMPFQFHKGKGEEHKERTKVQSPDNSQKQKGGNHLLSP